MNKKPGVILVLSISIFLVSFLICWQIKTIQNSDTSVLQLQREEALRDEVLKWQENYENVKERLDETEKKLSEYMESISDTDKTIQLLQQEVSELNVVSGLTEVKGKGIIITVKDAEVLNPLYLAEDQIVHDNDLLQIVNELRAGGAEAISINNQRLTSLSAIRCVGPSILVNDVKIGAPFVIKAIGNVDYLYSGINLSGGVVDIMRKYGISIEVERSENVVIPKYEGSIKISQGN